ncbi:efflux transporter outer membrane subunit [Roseibacillus ishigakijimensis]|uniref:Efflux transporter outer membrane subunit n=1 Tax=Roseibacillus ishigakijimensis TaxID=454146 RepID=A0A934RS19_9BACT|nr:efflux transporter outer membrane subunit [Roseibacillus ishigakijimensis]MBK1833466.1 efflux transporter outer membrane subunit [Roseibacillus ishigakijimensis]
MQHRRQNFQYFGHWKSLSPLFLTLAFGACQSLPTERPVREVSLDLRSAYAAAQADNNGEVATGWLRSLNDATLTRIVEQALANNPNLQATATRLKSAREGTIIGRANRLPSVDGSGRTILSRQDGDSSDSFGLSLDASWEPDVWGRLRDLETVALANYEATVADFRSARLSLAVNTAQSWCNLITAEKQLTLARETLASFQKNYQIIQRGYKLGTLRPLDDAFGRSNIASAERSLKARQLDRDEAARSLQLLLGTYPDAALTTQADLPEIPAVRAGLPSELLARRPDLTARRWQILASASQADASRKNLLPNFRLTTGTGSSSPELMQLLDASRLASSLAASIAQNFYSGGELSARARQALADNENQIHLYQRDVLQALREVESSLATDESLARQEESLLTEVGNTALAEKWAESDFVEGLDVGNRPSILEVLEAQRRALNARASLISLRNQRLQNHLDLLLALGGSI